MKLAHRTWTQVETYLKHKKTLIIPIGSVEQHGPTGLIGTDYLTAQAISEAVGSKTNTLVAPPLCYGMALHHMAFPGSATLQPTTLIQVIKEVVDSFTQHGFQDFIFINGHGGNMAIVTSAFCDLKGLNDERRFELINWWKIPDVQEYEKAHFGDQSGFHATIGEVATTMHTDPEAFKDIENQSFEIERPEHDWPLSAKEFRETFPDGRMESNPGLATKQHGQKIFELTVDSISEQIQKRLDN